MIILISSFIFILLLYIIVDIKTSGGKSEYQIQPTNNFDVGINNGVVIAIERKIATIDNNVKKLNDSFGLLLNQVQELTKVKDNNSSDIEDTNNITTNSDVENDIKYIKDYLDGLDEKNQNDYQEIINIICKYIANTNDKMASMLIRNIVGSLDRTAYTGDVTNENFGNSNGEEDEEDEENEEVEEEENYDDEEENNTKSEITANKDIEEDENNSNRRIQQNDYKVDDNSGDLNNFNVNVGELEEIEEDEDEENNNTSALSFDDFINDNEDDSNIKKNDNEFDIMERDSANDSLKNDNNDDEMFKIDNIKNFDTKEDDEKDGLDMENFEEKKKYSEETKEKNLNINEEDEKDYIDDNHNNEDEEEEDEDEENEDTDIDNNVSQTSSREDIKNQLKERIKVLKDKMNNE